MRAKREVKQRRTHRLAAIICILGMVMMLSGCRRAELVIGDRTYRFDKEASCLTVSDEIGERTVFDQADLSQRISETDSIVMESLMFSMTAAGYGYELEDEKGTCIYLNEEGVIRRISFPIDDEHFQNYRESVDELLNEEIGCLGTKDPEELKEMIQVIVFLQREHIQEYEEILKLCGYSAEQRLDAVKLYSKLSRCASYVEILKKQEI